MPHFQGPSASTTRRLGHLFWIAIYFSIDMGWIWVDQLMYRHFSHIVSYDLILHGQGCAPEQYRIAAPFLARLIETHLHLHSLIAACVLMDLLGSFFLSLLLYHALNKQLCNASVAVIVCARALLGLWMMFYLYWTYSDPRAETIPSCLYVVFCLLLIDKLQNSARRLPLSVYAAAFALLALAQGWGRADVAIIFCSALCLSALLPLVLTSSGRRGVLFAAGTAGTLLSGGALLYLAHVLYPGHHYCGQMVVLFDNLRYGYNYIPFLTFMPPLIWALVALGKRFATLPAALRTILIATCLYIPVWSLLGNWSEARIGVPFAMGLLPFLCVTMSNFICASTSAPAVEA